MLLYILRHGVARPLRIFSQSYLLAFETELKTILIHSCVMISVILYD